MTETRKILSRKQGGNCIGAKQKERNLSAGEIEAKRLLLLMDHDQGGKVSKQEFMSFMEEELTRSRLTPHVGTHR